MWMNRGKVDYVILMDWNSTFSTLKNDSPLHSLREALIKVNIFYQIFKNDG